MRHQTNQVFVTSLMCRVLAGKCSGSDVIEIKYLKTPSVRSDPNLESVPVRERQKVYDRYRTDVVAYDADNSLVKDPACYPHAGL
jgi:hypothetical protein